jgi:L-threonylcarbamoyladenylate synthase
MSTRVVRIDVQDPDPHVLAEAASILRAGGLVAFPTETVYGLGAHALDPAAVDSVFRAKGRPATDPVIVHLAAAAQLTGVARDVPASAGILADAFWPGALTLILSKQPAVPDAVTAGLATVGVRVPSHAVAHRLLVEAAIPVAAPSANRFSRPSPTTADHVLADLDGRIDLVLDGGPTSIGLESTILDLTVDPPIVRRPGGVSIDALRGLLPDITSGTAMMSATVPQLAPGQLLRHYAPRAPLTFYRGTSAAVSSRMAADARTAAASGSRVGILAPEEDLLALAPRLAAVASSGRIVTERLGSRTASHVAARDLFAALRALDATGVDLIFASAPEEGELSEALIDRLTRAAEGRVISCH